MGEIVFEGRIILSEFESGCDVGRRVRAFREAEDPIVTGVSDEHRIERIDRDTLRAAQVRRARRVASLESGREVATLAEHQVGGHVARMA